MPNLNELKALNRPNTVPPPQEAVVSISYIPTASTIPSEEWQNILSSQAAVVQRLEILGEYISTLPNTEDVSRMMKNYYQSVYNGQLMALENKIQSEHQEMQTALTAAMNSITKEMVNKTAAVMKNMEQTLQHRDMLPWKLKVKWTAVGLLSSTVLYTLLSLLKIL